MSYHETGTRISIIWFLRQVCIIYFKNLQILWILFTGANLPNTATSLFSYAIEVWDCAHNSKYLSLIDRFCKRAVKYGYTAKFTLITDLIRERGLELWKNVTTDRHCLSDLLPWFIRGIYETRVVITLNGLFGLKGSSNVLWIDVVLILFRFSIYMLSLSIYYYNVIIVNSHVCLWVMFSVHTNHVCNQQNYKQAFFRILMWKWNSNPQSARLTTSQKVGYAP